MRRRPRRRWWREQRERRERVSESGLATHLYLAHLRDDVGVEVDHLAAGRDERDHDHEDDEGQDERVLDETLAALARGTLSE